MQQSREIQTDSITDPQRLASLRATQLLDSAPDPSFDRLTLLATKLLKCPASVVTLVDEHRQFFKSCVGLPEPWATSRESPLSYSFCRQAVICNAPLIVRDAHTDDRVKDNAAVVEFGVRAYAGIPIRTRTGDVLGSFCVFDGIARDWSDAELEILTELASSVESEIELVTLASREQEQHQLLKVIIDESPLAISVIGDDARVHLWNNAAEEMFGYPASEVLDRPLPIVPAEKQEECRLVREQLADGKRLQGISTYRCRRDQSKVHVKLAATPLIGYEGEAGRHLLIFDDVSEQVRADREREALVQREIQARQDAETAQERYRNLVDGLDAIVWEADANTWEFSFVSERAEQILGYPIEQWLSDRSFWPSIIHAEDRDAAVNLCRNATHECRDHDFEYRAKTRDGRTVWLRDIVYVVADEAGRPFHLRGVMVDITAEKELEKKLRERAEQLSEMDARKNEFLAVLAHELRNPLAPISNAAELLPLCQDKPEEVAEIGNILQGQASQLVRLIDDLMDLSRITRRKIQLQKEQVSIVDILKTSASSVRPTCEAQQHQLQLSIDAGTGLSVFGDRVRLVQVFINILNNACKYTPDGGTIHLHCARVDDNVEISVEDNGIGISPEDSEGIFEMFTQVESSVRRSQGGLGIGLTLVKQLVDMHDGTVFLDREHQQSGCRFVVRLPLVQGAPIQQPAAECKPMSGPLNVVVIDDVRAVATLLVKLIEALGHNVRMALNADEGIEIVKTEKPDVVFTDICMPGKSGYEVAQELRAFPDLSNLTIIAMSGNGHPEDIQKGVEAGFDRHLVKPASSQVLRKVFSEIIASRSASSEIDFV